MMNYNMNYVLSLLGAQMNKNGFWKQTLRYPDIELSTYFVFFNACYITLHV